MTNTVEPRPLIEHGELVRLLDYCPNTGDFHWKVSIGTKRAGSLAGRTDKNGYKRICIHKKFYESGRLAWFYATGEWPVNYIDHINGLPSDNRIANLRKATPQENQRNKPVGKNNTSGHKGVRWLKKQGKWRAVICISKKTIHLGTFSDLDAAIAAREAGEKKYFGEFRYAALRARQEESANG